MSASETCVARAARKFSSVTSQIFRCRGLQYTSPGADRLGNHDLLYWFIFLIVLAGWFLFLFLPQRERVELLTARLTTLTTHLKEEQKELGRLQTGINALMRGDPSAWERAARARLGWLEPGEMTDMRAWSQSRPQTPAPAGITPGSPPPLQPARPASPIAPRPAIPPLPLPLLPVRLQIAGTGGAGNGPLQPAVAVPVVINARTGGPHSQQMESGPNQVVRLAVR